MFLRSVQFSCHLIPHFTPQAVGGVADVQARAEEAQPLGGLPVHLSSLL